ncbi:MAG TPA: Hsp20/alpha crystallin family protein [Planctomycetota bacterium]|nr:Hsp20/alpha crystallin family protein [Planctomycetota bacterium]
MTTRSVSVRKQAAPELNGESTRSSYAYRPSVDIVESAEELTLYADLPGVSGEDIDIEFEQGVLAIHGQVSPRKPEGASYLHQEYGIGDFHRTFQVSEAIDPERIQAEHEAGVLVLHLPKTEAVKPRRIQIQSR